MPFFYLLAGLIGRCVSDPAVGFVSRQVNRCDFLLETPSYMPYSTVHLYLGRHLPHQICLDLPSFGWGLDASVVHLLLQVPALLLRCTLGGGVWGMHMFCSTYGDLARQLSAQITVIVILPSLLLRW